jgi:hypothetical protein
MEPLTALSLASAVIQITDFAAKVVACTKEIQSSVDGTTEQIEVPENASANLGDLVKELAKGDFRRNAHKSRSPDDMLVRLAGESHALASEIRETTNKMRRKKDGTERVLSFKVFAMYLSRRRSPGTPRGLIIFAGNLTPLSCYLFGTLHVYIIRSILTAYLAKIWRPWFICS